MASRARRVFSIAGLALLLPAAALADPQPLGPSGNGAQVAVGPDGRAAVALWGATELAVRRAALGQPFGPARAVLTTTWIEPMRNVALDADGGGVAIFERRDGYRRVRASVFAVGGIAPRPHIISTRGRSARWSTLAASPAGETVAAWVQNDGRSWHVEAAVRGAGAPGFGPAQRLSGPVPRYVAPYVAVGEAGDAVVIWATGRHGAKLSAAVRRPGGGFGAVETVAGRVGTFAAAVGPDGAIALAFITDGDDGDLVLRVATRRAQADEFGPARTLDHSDFTSHAVDNLVADVAGDGRVAVLWGVGEKTRSGPKSDDRYALRVYDGVAGGALSRTAEIGVNDWYSSAAGLALADDGAAVVGWDAPDRARHSERYKVARRPPGGRFGAPVPITPPVAAATYTAGLRVLPGGGALAVWDVYDVEGSAFDVFAAWLGR